MIPLLLLLCFQEPEFVIPSVGRPDCDFYNAAGEKVVVTQQLEPTKLKVGEWATYTLDIRGLLNAKDVDRPKLEAIPFFKRHFQIEDMPDPTEQAKDQRRFIYRLRPRDAAPNEIPPFAFRYYDPRVQDAEAAFRLTAGGAVPITVVTPDVLAQVPSFRVPATGREIERFGFIEIDPNQSIPLILFAMAFVLPLAFLLVALAIWFVVFPSQASRARIHQNRLASRTLGTIRSVQKLPHEQQADAGWKATTGYLMERLELQGNPKTAEEYAEEVHVGHLELAGGVEAFLKRQEHARFGRVPVNEFELEEFVESIEASLEAGA